MARNRFPGYCYCCGEYVPTGYGHFERHYGTPGIKWRIKCVKCASGRIVTSSDHEVLRAIKQREEYDRRNGEFAKDDTELTARMRKTNPITPPLK